MFPAESTISPAREPPSLWATKRGCWPGGTKHISWLSGLVAVTRPKRSARDRTSDFVSSPTGSIIRDKRSCVIPNRTYD